MSFKNVLNALFPQPPQPLKPGLYHYMREADGMYTRFHLRVEPDGCGLLMANATAAARLTPPGAFIVKSILENRERSAMVKEIFRRFKGASESDVQRDITQMTDIVTTLASPEDNYPIINLADPVFSPYQVQLIAPFHADIPIAEPERIIPLLDCLWAAGIPHVTILTTDTFEPAHLVRIVERAEDMGMITGVRGFASCLSRGSILSDIARAGIDHATVLYVSHEQPVHDAVCGTTDHEQVRHIFSLLHDLEVCPVAEIPLTRIIARNLEETIESLQAMNVKNVSFFAIARTEEDGEDRSDGALRANALPQLAAIIEETSQEFDVRYLWQPPVRRDSKKSLEQQIKEGPRCSGDVSIRVETDGSVIPPRGQYRSAGNLLTDSWETIWNDDAFKIYRERIETPTRCETCPGLAICAADCPRDPRGWAL